MTQSSYFLTNGSSLEDCHTNFFALADLCGIKWRQYSCDKNFNDLIDDPILSSYAKCINANLLCVWRRVRINTQDQANRGLQDNLYNYTKELWIFWYGDEPDFGELVSVNLIEGETGTWEVGLSYDCRTLLFKALHNLIERCLLSKGYARLGRWFFLINNGELSDILKDETQVTFAFNFFLHGDSNVCACVDVRQHTAIRRISSEDIQAAHNIPGGLGVMLSPYGLQGYLTGYVFNENDQNIQKFASDWSKIFPLANSKKSENIHMQNSFNQQQQQGEESCPADSDLLNKVVEVIVGDYKMKYPVSYIYITEIDLKMKKFKLQNANKLNRKILCDTFNNLMKEADDLLENVKLAMTPYCNQIPNDTFFLKNNCNRVANCFDASDKVDCIQEDSLNNFDHRHISSNGVLKKSCHCNKCQQSNLKKQMKSNNALLPNGMGGSLIKSKDKCLEKEKTKYFKNSTPFHHRSSLNIVQDNSSLFLTISSMSQSIVDSTSINTSVSINTNLNQSNVTPIIMSYKSPVSTSTSSILNTPGIESSPLSNFNLDAAEHTSPNTGKDELSSINTPNAIQINSSPKEKSTFDLLSPTVNSCDTNNVNATITNNSEATVTNGPTEGASNNQPANATEVPNPERTRVLKRSLLYRNIYDDNGHDLRTGLLYDFSCELECWEIPAPKNRRLKNHSASNDLDLDLGKGYSDHKDPYEFNDFDDSHFDARLNESTFDPSSNMIENVNISEKDLNTNQLKASKVKLENDLSCVKNGVNSKTNNRHDDDFNDGGDFINSSGDESNDVQVTKIINGNANILGPAELSRMFPTPPSLEAMVSSPCNNYVQQEGNKCDTTVENDKTDHSVALNSSDSDSKDWSFVYKAPIQSTFITSTKYAPLENVEKHNLPSHCYYKHNVKNTTAKNHLLPYSSMNHFNPNLKTKPAPPFCHMPTNKINATFPNSMIRNVRPPPGPNMSPMNPNFINRMRPPMNMASPMYNFPPENFRPNMALDSPMSSMQNFISSPVHNFDNRKPFLFHQQSMNSPGTPNVMVNSPINNYGMHPQKIASPVVGPNMFMNANMDIPGRMNPRIFEVNSLMLNLLLSDSMFNLFRDHNYESCSICVCNMNIKGSDVGIYLPDSFHPQPQGNCDFYPCTCGFSSVSNRHLSQFSGLFYEDEVDITGKFYDPSERKEIELDNNIIDKDLKKSLSDVDENLINLIISQSSTIFPSCSLLARIIYCDYYKTFKTFSLKETSMRLFERDPQKLVYDDCTNVTLLSLNMARVDSTNPKQNLMMPPHMVTSKPLLHDWPFRKSNFAINNHEVILMLKTLQPVMQESVQRKGSEVTYNAVKGPLTWRQFHLLGGRGTEYQCEPQPIPSLMVGYDKDCVALSPFGLKFWEKLSLEPYSITRNIFYIVMVPDNEYIMSSTRNFFKELTTTYEILRFGRHTPMTKLFKDGIYPIGTNSVKKPESVQMDEWFNSLGESSLASKIQLYAHAFNNLIHNFSSVPNLFEVNSSKSNFDNSHSFNNNSSTMSMNGNASNMSISNSSTTMSSSFNHSLSQRSMNNFSHVNNSENQIERLLNEIDSHNNNNANNSNNSGGGGNNDPNIYQISNALHPPDDDEDDPHKQPSIVIYIVEPFSPFEKQEAKLSCMGLLKSFSLLQKSLPDSMRNNVHLQMISIESIMSNDKDFRNISKHCQLKELAFSVFSQCKQQLFIQSNIKSLTGLGPAASFELFLKNKNPMSHFTQLYTTPYILAPMKDKQTELGEMFGDRREKSQILFCCYCLTEDQKWLLASCTNDKGDILHTKVINIHVPNRTRRKHASVRRYGLDKLMKFIQTVMAESVQPWRLVIGRLGHIGHGELKDWACLLSKKSLLKYSRRLRDECSQCQNLALHDQPAIYSACLISLEADTGLRVLPNYYTPDERFSSSCNTCSLSTPEDASCTHILVFPTSATTQPNHTFNPFNDELFDMEDEIQVDEGLEQLDIFDNLFDEGLMGSPRRDEPQPDSPGGGNRQVFNASTLLKNTSILDVEQDEPAQLLQQPLALAFYVSTARTGPLPRWFWANCPHLQNICPVFLKSALLIHTPFVQQNSDDLLHSNNRDCHSLDSNLTTDVLRCVLEGYNSLSWLALNPETNDRLSCLPLHIQVLMQLYHSVQAFT